MKVKKAYENVGFLKSSAARPIRILAEYLEPQSRFEWADVHGTIVIMGSSRLVDTRRARARLKEAKAHLKSHPDDPEAQARVRTAERQLELARYYDDAREVAKRLTRWANAQKDGRRYLICTGAGPGIMEAGNRGAREARGESIGLGISMNIQEPMNPYVTPRLRFIFHYFFMRKFWFIYLAKAVLFFPGGFGTMDELFEVLTLKQTGKITRQLPLILYGRSFWERVIDWDYLLEAGLISPRDPSTFHYCDTPDEVMEYLVPLLTNDLG